jgi:peptide/nickel transport system substrate-binding protein
MSSQKISRREFLHVGAATAAGAALAACQPKTVIVEVEKEKVVTQVVEIEKEVTKIVAGTPVVEKVVETRVVEVEKEVTKIVEVEREPGAAGYQESPLSTQRVKAGSLPPVEERLPSDPKILEVYEEIGQYGGTMHIGTIYASLFAGDGGVLGRRPNPLVINPDISTASPYYINSWEQSEDKTSITLFLRKGLKWSDGAPFTADDFVWWYENHLMNTDITPVVAKEMSPGGEPLVVEKIDDYTMRYVFAAPAATFLVARLAHYFGFWQGHALPGHYLEQFHINFNSEAGDLATAEGFDYWYQLYGRQRDYGQNVDFPRLAQITATSQRPDAIFYERNPFYWVVDTEGNQLPYIDKMLVDRVADRELENAKVLAGEYDFSAYNVDLPSYSAYAQAATAGDFRVLLWNRGNGSEVIYNFNMNIEDEVLAQIHYDKRFRQAMSLAINREEVNKVIYYGQARPRQLTVTPLSRFFKQEYEDAYANYDPDRANELLDEMGLQWDATKTVRLRPDGQPLEYVWDYYGAEVPEKGPITEMCLDYWAAIGVKMTIKEITRELLNPRIYANEEPMSLWHGDECNDILFALRPKWFAPIPGDESCWAFKWGLWYSTQGTSTEALEPPQDIKDLYEWLDNYNMYGTEEWAYKLLDSQAENVWTIGVVGNAPHPVIARNNLRNVVEEGMWNWDDLWTYPYFPEQWFFKA